MNNEEDYASESDQSDEDFCLENGENDDDSEAGSSDDSDSEDAESAGSEDENGHTGSAKSKKKVIKAKTKQSSKVSKAEEHQSARSTRQSGVLENGKAAQEKDELESDEEVDKSRSDALWADFLSDVGDKDKTESKPKPKPKEPEKPEPTKPVEKKKETVAAAASVKKITEVLDFAGEQVTVQKTVSSGSSKENQEESASSKILPSRSVGAIKRPANGVGGGGGGLGSLLNQLGKKKKMSVLEKSQLDWKTFKNDEGIDEELQTHNKGKDGYLERQDFLQRTDLRQFEIEKNMRQARRQN